MGEFDQVLNMEIDNPLKICLSLIQEFNRKKPAPAGFFVFFEFISFRNKGKCLIQLKDGS